MSFFSVVKVEWVKLYHKRLSLLLLLFLIPPVLFGVGMFLSVSFFVSDGGTGGVDAVGVSLSGLGFAVNMMEQSKYIIFLVVIILAAASLSGELENGQMKSEIIRICSRSRIVGAKYTALLMLVFGAIILSLLWSILIYSMFVRNTVFASGQIFDELSAVHVGYIVFSMLGIGTAVSVTFLLGTKMKTFPCFAVSYILWFVSLYTDFIENMKLLVPYNMPNALLSMRKVPAGSAVHAGLYIGYCLIFLLLSNVLIKISDIKS